MNNMLYSGRIFAQSSSISISASISFCISSPEVHLVWQCDGMIARLERPSRLRRITVARLFCATNKHLATVAQHSHESRPTVSHGSRSRQKFARISRKHRANVARMSRNRLSANSRRNFAQISPKVRTTLVQQSCNVRKRVVSTKSMQVQCRVKLTKTRNLLAPNKSPNVTML